MDPELATRPRPLRLTQARIGDTLHHGNGTGAAYSSVPEVLDADLASVSANEWLVRNVPLVRGDIEFGAVAASAMEAAALGTSPGAALFLVQRATWNAAGLITAVRLTYAPGYRMHATL